MDVMIGKYDDIRLGNGEIIIIDRPVVLYVLGDVILNNSSEIQVVDANTGPDASLTLYLGGDLISQNGATLNNMSEDPKRLTIYGLDTCNKIEFKSSGTFYGTIYAPSADVIMHNSVEVFGAITSETFSQDLSSKFHYDASLRDVNVDDQGVLFVVKQWHEE